MNIVNKVTWRHMRLNKKRTLVTMAGVIIAVSMITAVASLAASFQDLLIRDTMASSGLWHVEYQGLDQAQLQAVKGDEAVLETAVGRDVGYAALSRPKSRFRPYLFVREYNGTGFRNFSVDLLEGRLPEKSDELLVPQDLLERESLNYKIGDRVELSLGERAIIPGKETEQMPVGLILSPNSSLAVDEEGARAEYLRPLGTKAYTIVGIMDTALSDYKWKPSYTCLSYLDPSVFSPSGQDAPLAPPAVSESSSEGSHNAASAPPAVRPSSGRAERGRTVDAWVALKNPDRGLFDHVRRFAQNNGIKDFRFNNELLRYSGIAEDRGLKSTLFSLCAVIILIISAGSIALIYNAFAISVSERVKHLGMLSTVGATARQKKNSVFFEGAVIGAISIPLGIGAGLLGIGVTFQVINPVITSLFNISSQFRVVIQPWAIAAAVLVSAATIFISIYVPARRASRTTPMDAVRQTQDLKLTRKAVRTSRITARIFGVEGDVALKNLKRNRRRYKATVFSLVISLVLFLSAAYFGESMTQAYRMTGQAMDFNVSAAIITRFPRDGESYARQAMALGSEYAEEAWETKVKDFPALPGSGVDMARLAALDDKTLAKYAEKAGVSLDMLMETGKNGAILVNSVTYRDPKTKKFMTKQILDVKDGQSWNLYREAGSGEDPQGGREQEAPADNRKQQAGGKGRPEEPEQAGEADSGQEAGGLEEFDSLNIEAVIRELPPGISVNSPDVALFVVSKPVYAKIVESYGEDGLDGMGMHYALFRSDQPALLAEALEDLAIPSLYISDVEKTQRNAEQMLFLINVFVYGFITLITLICAANILNTISTSVALRRREFAMLRSIGMTPEGFNKMIRCESVFYGLKALLYSLPLSMAAMYLLYKSFGPAFEFEFVFPWTALAFAMLAVFGLVLATMLYAVDKIKKQNIIDCLRQESI